MISRKKFLIESVIGGAAFHPSVKLLSNLFSTSVPGLTDLVTLEFEFNRSSDLISLHFYFINIRRSGTALIKKRRGEPAYMIIRVPRMHVTEHVVTDCQYFQNDINTPEDRFKGSFFDKNETVKSFVSSYSFLAFRLNFGGATFLNLIEDELLNWNKHEILTSHDVKDETKLPTKIIHSKNPKDSAYPILSPFQKHPFLTASGVPVSFFELPYKMYLSPILPRTRDTPGQITKKFLFGLSNKAKKFKLERQPFDLDVSELYNNQLLLFIADDRHQEYLSPNFRILGYATERGIELGKPNQDESLPDVSTDPAYKNNCAPTGCLSKLRTGGLLLNGSDNPTGFPKPGGNHRENLAYLNNVDDGTDRDITSTIFLISAWGGYTYIKYFNKDSLTYQIISFKEKIVLGRDEYIEVITEGYDQWGIKCYYIQIAKANLIDGNRYMQYYVIIKYPEKDDVEYEYNYARKTIDNQNDEFVSRRIPLKNIRAVTKSTPPLDPIKNIVPIEKDALATAPDDCINPEEKNYYSFAINYRGKPLEMEYEGKDHNGNTVQLVKPLIFIDKALWLKGKAAEIKKVFDRINSSHVLPNGDNIKDYRIVQSFKQKLAYAPLPTVDNTVPPGSDEEPNTDPRKNINELETDKFDLHINLSESLTEKFPCLPRLKEAFITLPHLQGLLKEQPSIAVEYATSYVDHAFSIAKNKAQVFVNLTDSTLSKIESSLQDSRNIKALGGLITPDIPIKAISILDQSVSMYENVSNVITDGIGKIQKISPKEILRGKFPELFKGIDLVKILGEFIPIEDTPIFNVIQEFEKVGDAADQFLQDVAGELLARKAELDNDLATVKNKVIDAKNRLQTLLSSEQAKLMERFQVANNEIAHCYQIITQLAAAPGEILKKEKAFIDAQLQNYALLLTQEVDQLSDRIITPIEANVATAKQKLKIIYDDERKSILDKVAANYTALQTSLSSLCSAINGSDIEASVIRDYTTIKAALKVQKDNYLGIRAVVLQEFHLKKDQDATAILKVVTDAKIQAFVDGVFKIADEVSMLETMRKLIVDNSPEKVYHFVTYFLKKLEEEYANLPDRTGAKEIKDLITILQSRIKLYKGYYTGRFNELEREVLQLKEDYPLIFKGAVVTKIENLSNELSKITFPISLEITNIQNFSAEINKFYEDHEYSATILKNLVHDTINLAIKDVRVEVDRLKKEAIAKLEEIKNYFTSFIKEKEQELRAKQEELLRAVGPDIEAAKAAISKIQALVGFLKNGYTLKRNYRWSTKNFRDADFGIVRFSKHDYPATELEVVADAHITLNYLQVPPAITSYSFSTVNTVRNFSLVFLSILDVSFEQIRYEYSTTSKGNFTVKIQDVKFAGSLSFMQALQSFLQTLDKNLRLEITPNYAELGYSLPIPDLSPPAGGFGFANLSLNMGLRIPFDGSPLQFKFSISKPYNKFRVMASIYAGWGYFGITVEPKTGVKEIEIALEMGAYAGLSLGPLNGHVQFGVGLYYRRTRTLVIIRGYISAEGTAQLWIASVSLFIYLGFESNGNYVEGQCLVSYGIKIGFFEKKFEKTFSKRINGSQASANKQNELTAERSRLAALPATSNQRKTASIAATNWQDKCKRNQTKVFEEYWESFF